jgi:geranylgeranyl diphosphate synthase type II
LFKVKFQEYIDLVEAYLEQLPWNQDDFMCRTMHYSLAGGGKRVRPVLALAAAETVGSDPRRILSAAIGLEMIHTYSLIHDDLPAMDNDDYRRGRLSNHMVFGEGNAILAGDGLLTHAFEILTEPLPVPPEKQLRVIREVAAAAGYRGMVGGQADDLAGEGKALRLPEIERIHRRKTGALLTVSLRLGAILGGGTAAEIEALTAYAEHLGLAFQIKDDILDQEGDSAAMGKPSGSDLRRGKATYPSLMGLSGAKDYLREHIVQAQAALSVMPRPAPFLHEFADFIEQRQC